MSAFFAFTVLPAGAVVCLLLSSGNLLAMKAGSFLLSLPVRIGNFQISIAVLLTAICGAMTLVSYSHLQRTESRMDQVTVTIPGAAALVRDQQLRDAFKAGRNFYMALLGLTLWAMAWRLKALYTVRQLTPPRQPAHYRSLPMRLVFFLAGLACLALADLPLCRLNYSLTLVASVTPVKERLISTMGPCESVMASSATGQCQVFCSEVRSLSQERLGAILWARRWHIFGRIAAQVFDDARGVEQGQDRINDLFAKKSCAQVLRSVDKSNTMVNFMCVAAAGGAIVGAFAAFAQLFGTLQDNEHRD